MPRQEGQFLVEDFLAHTGGLNSADSPFIVKPDQATDGYNWEYLTRGGITKRQGRAIVGSNDATTPYTLGLGLYDPASGTRSVMRAANKQGVTTGKLYALGLPGLVTSQTALSDDTATAHTAFFNSSSTQPVCTAMTNTPSSSVLWCAGGTFTDPSDLAANTLLGAYSATKCTTNGVPQAPLTSGNITIATTTADVGYLVSPSFITYSVTLVKASTGAEGNALPEATEAAASIKIPSVSTTAFAYTSQVVHLKFTLTSPDVTKYSAINLYKSEPQTAAGGTPDIGFTSGVYMGQIPITASAIWITDYGLDTAPAGVSNGWAYLVGGAAYPTGGASAGTGTLKAYVDTASLVPRAGNIGLDQSPLPTGTYNSTVLWNNRLVTASGSTIYVSDTEKPEAWPLTNQFAVPSGGPITALGVVGLSSGVAGVGINEALVIFKEREMWTLLSTGSPFDYTTWQLSFMSSAGCPSQRLIVNTDHGIFWLNNRGIFSWNAAGKPLYLSQPIEDKFTPDGDIVYTDLYKGFGVFYQQKKQIRWTLGSNTYGTQAYTIKLDLRLTMAQVAGNLTETITHGIFSPDVEPVAMYAALSATSSAQGSLEYLYQADASGNIYQADTGAFDLNSTGFAMAYTTPTLTMGTPATGKEFSKVIAWVLNVGQADMQLNYWTDWKQFAATQSTNTQPVAGSGTVDDVWDSMLWDQGVWDPGSNQVTPIVFNLTSQTGNNSSGTNLRLQFVDPATNNTTTPTLLGFSVYYTEAGTAF